MTQKATCHLRLLSIIIVRKFPCSTLHQTILPSQPHFNIKFQDQLNLNIPPADECTFPDPFYHVRCGNYVRRLTNETTERNGNPLGWRARSLRLHISQLHHFTNFFFKPAFKEPYFPHFGMGLAARGDQRMHFGGITRPTGLSAVTGARYK